MSRPYRIWDAKAGKQLPHRYYTYSKNAHNGALLEVRWAKVGVTLEVINVESGKMLGQYTRFVNTVGFRGA